MQDLPSLKSLLTRFALLAALPAAIAAVALVWSQQRQQGREVEARMQSRAQQVARALEGRLATIVEQLHKAHANALLAGGTAEALRDQAEAARLALGVRAVTVHTRDSHSRETPRPPSVQQALASGTIVYDDLSAWDADRWSTGVSVPSGGDDVRGIVVLHAHIDVADLAQLLASENLPAGWRAIIVDSRGSVLARQPNHVLHVGKKVDPQALAAMRRREDGAVEVTSLDGLEIAAAYQKVARTDWTTGVSVPRHLLYAPAWRNAIVLVVVVLVVQVLMLLLASGLRHRIMESMSALQRASLQVLGGMPVQVEPLTFREAGDVARALESSTSLLHASGEALKQSESILRAILATAKEAMILLNDRNTVVLANPAAHELFGINALQGLPVRQLFHAASWQHFLERSASVVEGVPGQASCFGLRDGIKVPLACSMSVFMGPGGTLHRALILRDLTRALADRAELLDAQRQLRKMSSYFQQTLLGAVEKRQAEVARELHDDVGSSLSGISLLLEAAIDAAPRARIELLHLCRDRAAAAAEAVRRVSRGMTPAGTAPGALLSSLDELVTTISQGGQVRCELRSRGNFSQLASEAATHVYRIVQEACTNATRHGRAGRIEVRLAGGPRAFRLRVIDDGAGLFDVDMDFHSGLGLRSMRARAESIGGTFEIVNRPGGGCILTVTWCRHALAAMEDA